MRKGDLGILLGALALAGVLGLWIFLSSGIQTGSWGLSFRQEGQAPIGNAGSEELRRYDAVYVGDTQGDYNAASAAGVPFLHAAYGFGTIDRPVPSVERFTDLPAAVDRMGPL